MPRSLPTLAPPSYRPPCVAWAVAPLLLLASLFTSNAWAVVVTVAHPHERGGYVWIDAQMDDLFPGRVRESLGRGMPATLTIHAELWRSRSGWFDRMEDSHDAVVRIRYEVWSHSYRLERMGERPLVLSTLDSVEVALSQPAAVRVGRVGDLKAQSLYYVVVFATLKPLSVEDVEEVEGWLSGEVQDKRSAGFGVITELPHALFDAVRNFAGFGDQRARAVSDSFVLQDLFPDR